MAEIQGLQGINFANGDEHMIKNRAGEMKIYNSSDDSWNNFQWPTTDTSTLIDSCVFLDYAFFVNGEDDNLVYSNGYTYYGVGGVWSEYTNLRNCPKSARVEEYGLRIHMARPTINGTTYSSRVIYSDLPSNDKIEWGIEYGSDLATTEDSAVVTSATALFDYVNIKVGDPFFIQSGENEGEYTVRSVDSNTQITLTDTLDRTETGLTYWTGGNWFDVARDDGDTITGFGKNSNELLIFKTNSLHRYNKMSGILRQVKTVPGTGSFRSIVNNNQYTYYYDPSGPCIRRYDPSISDALVISEPLADIIENIDDTMHANVVGYAVRSRFIEFFLGDITLRGGDTITNCAIRYDSLTEQWSVRSLPFDIEVATYWIQNDRPHTYVGTSDGKVLKVSDGYTYDDNDISFELVDYPVFPVGHDVMVDFQRLRLWIENGSDIQVLYKLIYMPRDNRSWTNSDWIPMKGKANADLVEFTFPIDKPRRACGVKFKFIQSSGYESFLIEKYKVFFSTPSIR